ncbi:hypothetical protein SFRURICE_000834 [Spodoptera frugiperda]|nr:hypothetical protein SFRURICE_000834 [Spodoptera frugiperda]
MGTAVALFLDLGEFASDVRRVAVQHRRVAVTYLTWVVQHDHLHNAHNMIVLFRHLPSTLPSLRSMVQPLNQGILSEGSSMLSPCQPEIGTNATVAGLYPSASNLCITCLVVWWLSGVHLVNANDKLFDTEGEGEESMFACLSVLADTRLELASTRSHDQNRAVSLTHITP